MTVRKRLEYPPGHEGPGDTEILYGARDHWRIVRVEPIESRVWPNSWRLACVQLGPHGLDRDGLDRRAAAGAIVMGTIDAGDGPEDVWPWAYPTEEAG